jgi:uncharacterized membrane protein
MSQATEAIVTILTAIVGVAILAVLVSKRSNTAGVLQAAGSAFSNALGVATQPVTGSQIAFNVGYPSGAGLGSF